MIIMKTKSFFLAIAILLCSNAFAYDFSAVCESGQTLCYKITSDTMPYTVDVTYEDDGTIFDKSFYEFYEPSYDDIAGDIIIPSSVIFNGTMYSVTGIDLHAFRECHDILSVVIPNSVTKIGEQAFYGCSGLEAVTIPNSVTIIEYEAFYGCSGLIDLTIPNTITSIGSHAFHGTGWYNSQQDGIIYLDGWCLGYKGSQPAGTLTIEEGTIGICDNAFSGCQEITGTLTFPNSVVRIGKGAFSYCSGFSSVIIPNSITRIEADVFWWCSKLTSVTIPNTVTSIGQGAFSNCNMLFSINIPNSVTEIHYHAFFLVKNIVYEGSATGSPWGALTVNGIIEDNLVYSDETKTVLTGCNPICTEVTIPNSVTSIGDYAFKNCREITEITIPNSVTDIGCHVFSGCDGLTEPVYNSNCFAYFPKGYATEYIVPNGIRKIAGAAFYDCNELTSITLPSSLISTGYIAFQYCRRLASVYYTGDVEGWCRITFDGSCGHPFCFSSGNLYINNELLTELVIPETVTEIKHHTFAGVTCITSIRIGDWVTSIGNSAFGNCRNIDTIFNYALNPPIINYSTFTGVSTSIPVIVPCGSATAYSNAEYWNRFTNIQEDCSVVEENEIADLQIYPNPVSNILNITSSEEISSVEIVNTLGQVVSQMDVDGESAVCDVENLPSGVYVVRIYSRTLRPSTGSGDEAQGTLTQRKFIKE